MQIKDVKITFDFSWVLKATFKSMRLTADKNMKKITVILKFLMNTRIGQQLTNI